MTLATAAAESKKEADQNKVAEVAKPKPSKSISLTGKYSHLYLIHLLFDNGKIKHAYVRACSSKLSVHHLQMADVKRDCPPVHQ